MTEAGRPTSVADPVRLDDLLEGDAAFPLPEVEGRVLQMLRQVDADPAELEAVLCEDPVFVDRLLRMVNSPLYGLNQEVCAVRHAIMVVGFRGLRSLSLASGVTVSMRRFMAVHGEEHGRLARHAMQVAAVARELAGLGSAGIHREELFVAGLLHDVGKVPLVARESYAGLASLRGADLVAAERQTFGLDHAQIGAELCRRWSVGRAIAEIVARHHEPVYAGSLAGAMATLRIADEFAHRAEEVGGDPDAIEAEPFIDPLIRIGLEPVQWTQISAQLMDALATAQQAMPA